MRPLGADARLQAVALRPRLLAAGFAQMSVQPEVGFAQSRRPRLSAAVAQLYLRRIRRSGAFFLATLADLPGRLHLGLSDVLIFHLFHLSVHLKINY